MSNISHYRLIPSLEQLPRPIWARNEQWDDAGSVTHWHQHPWGQFSYAVSGVLSVLTEQSRFVAPSQYAIWVPCGVSHQVASNAAAVMRSLYIAPSYLRETRWQSPLVVEVSVLVRALIQQFCQGEPLWEDHSPQQRLAMVLVDQIQSLKSARMQLPIPTDRRLLQLCQLMQRQPDGRQTMNQLAEQVGLSSRSVSRLFVLQTGLTFRQWRQRLRLFFALDCLERQQRVTEVAQACGYESLSAFVLAFRQQFGVTPGRYFHR